MRDLTGEMTLVRVYFGDSDKHGHQRLSAALLERLRREGFAGATVLHGAAGFGATSVLHTDTIERLSVDLPVVVEVVDSAERVDALRAILDEMLTGGFVTMEPVHVLRYAAGPVGKLPADGS